MAEKKKESGRKLRCEFLIVGSAAVSADIISSVEIPRTKGIVVADPTLCSGCKICELVCSLHHEGVINPALARLYVAYDPFINEHPEPTFCKQCAGPECMLVCPTGAIGVDSATGARVVDEEKCNGCGLCVKACFLGMIKLNPDTKKALKCDLCDGDPQCVKYCPQNALKYEKTKKGAQYR